LPGTAKIDKFLLRHREEYVQADLPTGLESDSPFKTITVLVRRDLVK